MLESRFFGFFMNGIDGLASGTAMRVTERGEEALAVEVPKRTPRTVGVANANMLRWCCLILVQCRGGWEQSI